MAKFYRTVIEVEVLSDNPIPPEWGLEDIAHEITSGDWSGRVTTTKSNEEVDFRRMAGLLEAQGSDASFLLGADLAVIAESETEEELANFMQWNKTKLAVMRDKYDTADLPGPGDHRTCPGDFLYWLKGVAGKEVENEAGG